MTNGEKHRVPPPPTPPAWRQEETLEFRSLPLLGEGRLDRAARRARRRAWLWAVLALLAAAGFLLS